jgi:hypothetical protein
MFPMKEKPVSTKYAKTPRREATGEDGKQQEREPEREDAPRKDDRAKSGQTDARALKLAERHRETLDYLAER